MDRLIADLFDLSRARLSGGIPVERGAILDLGDIATHVLHEAKLSAPNRDFDMALAGDPCGDWDAVRVQQVLTNLVSNAVRHGSADAPIRVAIDGARDDEVIVEVVNSGAIPAEVLPHIFDPFRSFSGDSRQNRKGLGLGLYIVQQIVRAHGGDVVATTTVTTTCIRVRLPRTAQARELVSQPARAVVLHAPNFRPSERH